MSSIRLQISGLGDSRMDVLRGFDSDIQMLYEVCLRNGSSPYNLPLEHQAFELPLVNRGKLGGTNLDVGFTNHNNHGTLQP